MLTLGCQSQPETVCSSCTGRGQFTKAIRAVGAAKVPGLRAARHVEPPRRCASTYAGSIRVQASSLTLRSRSATVAGDLMARGDPAAAAFGDHLADCARPSAVMGAPGHADARGRADLHQPPGRALLGASTRQADRRPRDMGGHGGPAASAAGQQPMRHFETPAALRARMTKARPTQLKVRTRLSCPLLLFTLAVRKSGTAPSLAT